MRLKLVLVIAILLMSTTTSVANPGGEGDEVRSRDCAGSCHADSSSNGQSGASIVVNDPGAVYAGLLMELTTTVEGAHLSDSNLIGTALLINDAGAKDLPAHDGWEVITDPNGGMNNYVELRGDFSNSNTQTWTLRAPSQVGTYTLYLAVQHGSPYGVAMTGISSPTSIEVVEVPENLPRLAADWEPVNTRGLGEETTITIETEHVDSFEIELKTGATTTSLQVEGNSFTIPAALNPGVVEWRVVMHGEGPNQTSPWFKLTASEPGWQVDETSLYMQGFALLLLCAALVNIKRKGGIDVKAYDHTDHVPANDLVANSMYGGAQEIFTQPVQAHAGPPLPPGGLPQGWTMDQWAHYGQEYLNSMGGGQQ